MIAGLKELMTATATPLASIFGSGFLVIVPILSGLVGPYSVLAMAAVCALAYAVGSVVRFNIAHFEPLLEADNAPLLARRSEQVADVALVLAYVISVSLYINILSAFLLHGIGLDNPLHEHIVTVSVISFIALVGAVRGLDMLQKLESYALRITLVIIVAVLIGFGGYDLDVAEAGTLQWPSLPDATPWLILTTLGGTLIVTQGFETSRYLGQEFDRQTRIRSSRLSQIVSTGVYLLFVALATPLMYFLGDTVDDSALIVLAGKAAVWLPAPLIAAAVLSQFSAAVADTIAGAGNMIEVSEQRIDRRLAYLGICGFAIVLAFHETLTLVALASRAFAFYYLLQCMVAIGITRNTFERAAIGLVAVVLAFITVFAVPVG